MALIDAQALLEAYNSTFVKQLDLEELRDLLGSDVEVIERDFISARHGTQDWGPI